MPGRKPSAPPSLSDGGNSGDERIQELVSKLHEFSLREASALPRVAIVGDQSSGKTSVFEALTSLSLPTENRPSTNFATHIRFQHSTAGTSTVKAFISPGDDDSAYEAAKEHLQDFRFEVEGCTLTGNEFTEILENAADHMGLVATESGDDDSIDQQLSDNVLNIEVSGPEVHSLNIIDFPGLRHNASTYEGQQDIEMIRKMIMEYISDPRTIIVAVADATNNIANQEVFEFAKAVDPQGLRTVGVLTKCDAIQAGDENKILRIARNKVDQLPHGWFVVRNRSPKELKEGYSLAQRNARENAFFAASPWNELSFTRTGASSLKDFIGDLVNEILQDNISNLVVKIQSLTSTNTRTTLTRDSSMDFSNPWNETWNEKNWHEKGGSLAGLREESITGPDSNEESIKEETTADSVDLEEGPIKRRPTILVNSFTVALTVALVMTLIALGCRQIAQEIAIDGKWWRVFLLFTAPLQIFVSLFFCQSLINTIFQLIGPVSQMNTNSKFYSAHTSPRLDIKNGPLPHVTIQCPVYKEGLEGVIEPTVTSLQAAIADYESHGGTANIFMNDDGMQLFSPEDARKRRAFYTANNIGWVARPRHNPEGEGLQKFVRRGKFKKASNMNFALGISIRVEEKLLLVDRSGIWTRDEEEDAYQRCLEEVLLEEQGRAWADGDIRVGDYILIVDSDTRIPVDCIIDAVSELEQSPQVAILQFSSGVMNVTTSFFENGITFFTNLIYTAIRYAVAAGDVSPFVGHNAFLRWSALQETSFHDPTDDTGSSPDEKFWSESHVSEDFDISLRLQTQGYHIRLGAYCGDGFKEGVSLTVYDELARWEKYAYGCNELLFHPVKYWFTRGLFTPLFKRFITSNMPLGSKVTILAYIGTYYAIGYAWIGSLLNYFLIGWLNGHLDHYYMNSWRVWVALVVVFSGAGNLALAVVRYRGEGLTLTKQLWICFRWVPLLFVFLGGISMHVSQALLSHMFSIDMTWGATAKEVEDTSFFIELPQIAKRFKWVFLFCTLMTALMICGVVAFPPLWRIDEMIAIFPLSCIVFSHFMLPVLLNPALMKFTW